ncbi:hypothetical protein [uncultured Acinetobacter sp.]|mgnify:FL=1|uniref:hypothetical protein n=1 Tax=uncultured Acinetobacter sp. TaxID=165433 RepID=UPI002611AA9B|nr:hypothetical protein [uncultured Acinetobacter sp.]
MYKFIAPAVVSLFSLTALHTNAATLTSRVSYTTHIPATCALDNTNVIFLQALSPNGTPSNYTFRVQCNTAYKLKLTSQNAAGVNQSKTKLVSISNTPPTIPYETSVTGPTNGADPLTVNGPAVTITPTAPNASMSYTLSSKYPEPLNTAHYTAGYYTDTITIEVEY